MPIIAPSVLAADFAHLGEDITRAVKAGVKYFHLDIMDGHFVSNISFGPDIARTVQAHAPRVPMDAHLMCAMPENFIEPFAKVGVELITFHLEIDGRRTILPESRWVYVASEVRYPSRIEHIIDLTRRAGVKVGLAVNPPTDPSLAAPFLDKIDRLLLMSVNPGFGGQKFMEDTWQKLERTVAYRARKGLQFDIQVDGGVDTSNAKRLKEMGADILVCGTSFFKADDFSKRLAELENS